jgi:hypothetical protein
VPLERLHHFSTSKDRLQRLYFVLAIGTSYLPRYKQMLNDPEDDVWEAYSYRLSGNFPSILSAAARYEPNRFRARKMKVLSQREIRKVRRLRSIQEVLNFEREMTWP